MSSTTTHKAPENGGSGGLSLAGLATAAASGVGVLGFVIFAGGVVLRTRFEAMGLPADRAVSLIPKGELISTGAHTLVPALLVALGVVFLLVALDPLLRDTSAMKASRQSLSKAQPVADLLPGNPDFALLSAAIIWVGGIVVAAFTLATVDVIAFLVLMLATLLAGVVIALAASRLKSKSAVFLVAFLVTGVFWVVRAYELTSQDLKVIPMAYSRAQAGTASRVEIGYFVAETSDRIFFASLPKSNLNELREFPRGETDDLEVGNLTHVANAEAHASQFAYNLCLRLNALVLPPPPKTNTKTKTEPKTKAEPKTKVALPCSTEYLTQLEETAHSS
jgi:hypothetical protein